MINRTNCPLFNTGLYIEKVNQSQAKIGMCCFQHLSPRTYNTIDFENNDYLQELRKVDTDVAQCSSCLIDERRGNQSHRQAHILANANNETRQTKLTTLTYNCENTCNLACITCGPRYSSKWKPDYQRMNIEFVSFEKQSTHKNTVYKDLDFSCLKFLHFQGGEPLLTDDHLLILSKIKEQNNLENVVVSYNTNGNFLPSPETLELWRQAKLVKLYFSIDAVGEQYNIVRNPGEWHKVEQVLLYYRDLDLPNLWIEIGTTVSLANVFYIQDIINWRDQFFSKTHNDDEIKIYITFAGATSYGGQVLALNNITPAIKSAALAYVATVSDDVIKNTLTSALNSVRGSPAHADTIVDYLNKIDQFRGTDWKTTLSKLHTAIHE